MPLQKKPKGKELIFICHKCGHNLYVEEKAGWVNKIIKADCPDCGEEPNENWMLEGYGSFKNCNLRNI